MTSTQLEVKDYCYFAGNEWRKAADDQFFEVHEPYSGQLFARVAAGSRPSRRNHWPAARVPCHHGRATARRTDAGESAGAGRQHRH